MIIDLQRAMDKGTLKYVLAELESKAPGWAEEVMLDQAHVMAGLAQALVRVDTGSLRDSIRVERGGKGRGWAVVRVRAGGYVINPRTGRLVDYAGIVEQRYPYMRPAYDAIKGTLAGMIEQKIVMEASVL